MNRMILLPAALFGLTGLAACGGGGALGLGASGNEIVLENGEAYPVGALSGSGKVFDPYILPDKHPVGMTAGIRDFLLADNSAYIWEIPVRSARGFAMGEGPYPLLFMSNGLIFDATGAGWFQLSNTFTDASRPGWRLRGDCVGVGPAVCDSYFSNVPPDFSSGGAYGTFEIRTRDDDDSATHIETLAVRAYTWGLPTPANAMPRSGSAQYRGPFMGIFGHEEWLSAPAVPPVLVGREFYEAAATINVHVQFTPAGGTITSIGAVANSGQLTGLTNDINGTFSISGSGTVSGNTFGGSISVPVTANGQVYNLSGTFDGGFFGPATGGSGAGMMPEEMAGTLSADDGLAAPQNVLVGGFQGDVQ